MSKVYYLSLLFILSYLSAQTQIDSLEKVLESNQFDTETEKVQLLNTLAEAYMSASPESRYTEAIILLEKEQSSLSPEVADQARGRFYAAMGRAYYYKDSYEGGVEEKGKSALFYEKAIPLLSSTKDSVELAEALLNCGTMILYAQKQKAYSFFQEAARIFQAKGIVERQVTCYGQLCTVLAAMGNVDEALTYSRKVLNLIPQVKDYYNIAQTCLSIGIVYMDAKKHKYAEDLFQEALKASKSGKDEYLIASTYMYLGANRIEKEGVETAELEEAKSYLDKAAAYYEEAGMDYVLQYQNVYYASYYCGIEEYDQALDHSNTYMNYMKDSGQDEILALIFNQRGQIFEAMGNLDSASYYLQKGVEKARITQNDFFLEQAYLKLYEIAKKEKDYQQALAYHELHLVYHDTIFNQRLQNVMGREGAKLDLASAQRAQKNAELQTQLLSSRNQLFGAVALGLLAILIIGGYLFNQLRKTRKQLENQNTQLTQLNQTKDKFFGIIAHDIRSPITALDGVGEQMNYYLSKNDNSKLTRLANHIDTTTKRLSGLLDNLLNWALLQTGMIPYHPNSTDISIIVGEIIELYQPLATAKGIAMQNNIQSSTRVYADHSALHAIIRNLINNALKFTAKNGQISINAKEENGKVFIEINDTGTGIHADQLGQLFSMEKKSTTGTAGEKGTGLGLMLCKELVALNKGTIKVMSELGKGSSFIFSVPTRT